MTGGEGALPSVQPMRTKLECDHGNITYQSAAVGIMNARRFSYFLAQARTDMDPDKWVIFAYDGVTAYQDPALPTPYIQSLCSPPSTLWNRY